MTTRAQDEFQEVMHHFRDAMLVTSNQEGALRARPMVVADHASDGDLWFVTDRHSGKVDEIASDPRVLVTMQGGGRYLSLTGHGEIVDDRSKIDQLWSEAWRVWFPNGKDSPELTLIHVSAVDGEFWDNSGLKRINYLFKAGRAYILGERVERDEEQHKKVALHESSSVRPS